jgi:hypothetical protein
MKRLVLFAALAFAIPGGANMAAAAELPAYQSMGFPITAVQMSVVGSRNVREVSSVPTLTAGGMPASPHQIAVLAAHKRIVGELAGKPANGRGVKTR